MAQISERKNFYEELYINVITPIIQVITELQRLFPDSVLFGSLFLYILTQNNVYGIFSLFMFETTIIHKIIATIFERVNGTMPSSAAASGPASACHPGFRGARKEVERMLRQNSYPSLSIFSLMSAAVYLFSSSVTFNDTLESMGQEWHMRFLFSLSFFIIIPIVMIIIRKLAGCESFGEILIAGCLGAFVGLILFFIHKALFGLEGINFLGLPYMVDKSDKGSDIYVCAPTTLAQS